MEIRTPTLTPAMMIQRRVKVASVPKYAISADALNEMSTASFAAMAEVAIKTCPMNAYVMADIAHKSIARAAPVLVASAIRPGATTHHAKEEIVLEIAKVWIVGAMNVSMESVKRPLMRMANAAV